jgi:uncharacterized repeat protein (TIGR03803 family)
MIVSAFVVWGASVSARAQSYSETVLYNFCTSGNCSDGDAPDAPLVQGADGNFYSITPLSYRSDGGTFFRITPSGSLTTLYNFCPFDFESPSSCADGTIPNMITQGGDGNFYGTTIEGGATGYGTVFEISTAGVITTLHSFTGLDGLSPTSVVQGTDGNFYGTTHNGGPVTPPNCPSGCGTIFKVTSSGIFTTLYYFCQQTACLDGSFPGQSLVQGTDGDFYGSSFGGGPNNAGTIFKITPSGSLKTLNNSFR